MKLNQEWVKNTNIKWYNELQKFKKKKYRKVKTGLTIFKTLNFLKNQMNRVLNGVKSN